MKQKIKIHSLILECSKKGIYVKDINLLIPKSYWFKEEPGYQLLSDKIYDGMIIEIEGLEEAGQFVIKLDRIYGHGESFQKMNIYPVEEEIKFLKEVPNKEYQCVVIK